MSYIYSHHDDDAATGFVYFATLAEAKQSAQRAANYDGRPITISRERLGKMPLRQLAAALLNHDGWGHLDHWELVVKPQRGSKSAADEYGEEIAG